MLKRNGARVSQSVHAVVEFFHLATVPALNKNSPLRGPLFTRSITISVSGITQRSALLLESAFNWDASGIWSNGGSWIRLNVSYKAAAAVETRLSASGRRDLGQVEAFHDGSCQQKKVIEFRARRRWEVVLARDAPTASPASRKVFNVARGLARSSGLSGLTSS